MFLITIQNNMTLQTLDLKNISHDLRNHMSGISGAIGVIAENLTSYKKQQAALGIKLDERLRESEEWINILAPYSIEAMQYVEDMLDISMAATGKFSLGEMVQCDLEKLIARLLIFNKSFILKHKITVKTQIDSGLPLFKCDERRLKQILTNLITNAVKYSPEGGEVLIKIECLQNKNWIATGKSPRNDDVFGFVSNISTPSFCHGQSPRNDSAIQPFQLNLSQPQLSSQTNQILQTKNHIQIEIIDSGIGMAEAEIAMALAGEGMQIDKSDLNKTASLDSHGLGLPIVKQLVELMGGELHIESEKGKGTKVSLRFG
jgi:signal transduction histidine kinase